ncbi:hypothetical protein HETIRDRAFT_163861 [Heterobasidion irregulare TC 32-1]|uniref:Uncharacterized protein n=1 Tax=Heterobasidion irregulare (strain TC 32-1) TaxID=747525 RepID=W4JWQ4_HETIT|nr:uncharacterized protein HETIRDRAFT_163861 [Heterobasidion irregulare TC 32-1]ETW77884.1 hypothetical protein HETIRDRAFT_163861 [Heterobasidion irregulare TC 32-1]
MRFPCCGAMRCSPTTKSAALRSQQHVYTRVDSPHVSMHIHSSSAAMAATTRSARCAVESSLAAGSVATARALIVCSV